MRGGESERGPPCGCAAYMWICGIVCVVAMVCVVAGERENEREGEGRGGGGEGERETTLRQNHSTSTAFIKTTRQAHHTNRSTLKARRYDSSIHPKRLSGFISGENPFIPRHRDTTVPVTQCNGLCHVTFYTASPTWSSMDGMRRC
jgi:hypothetical protein